MADQLTGVLHEIVGAEGRTARPRMSNYFSPQRGVFGLVPDLPVDPHHVIAALPVPVVDPNDPGAALLATTSGTPAIQLESALNLAGGDEYSADGASIEIPLRLVRASLEIGAPQDARRRLAQLDSVIPGDWRLSWWRGQCALLEGEFDKAATDFEEVAAVLPGELGPKLAIAVTAELRGAHDDAAGYYKIVWQTDHTYFSAAFGLARQRARSGDVADAITPLDQIPVSSAHFTPAGAAAIEIMLDARTPEALDEKTLLDAGRRAAALNLESAAKRAKIRLRVLGAALGWLQAGNTSTAAELLGVAFDEPGVRTGLEHGYRELARATPDMWERITLVEKANKLRPRTRL
jgi:serine/threonine-protein kinase PknG